MQSPIVVGTTASDTSSEGTATAETNQQQSSNEAQENTSQEGSSESQSGSESSSGEAQTSSESQSQSGVESNDETLPAFEINLGGDAEESQSQQSQETQQPTAQAATTVSWEDAIKTIDKKEVFKKLGLDERALEIAEFLASGGDAVELVENRLVDWTQVPADQLALQGLRQEYPTLTEQEIAKLFTRKFNQHEDADDDLKEYGAIEMKAYAEKIRQNKIQQQNKFKIPEAGKSKAQAEWEQQQEVAKAANEQAYHDHLRFFNEHEATKNLMQSKRVAVPLGDGRNFNFPVDKPELLTKLMTDGETWQRVVSTPQGEPDVAKQQLIALIALNPQKFIQDIYNSGKAFGVKSVVEEGQNAKRPTGQAPTNGSQQNQVMVTNTNGRGMSVRQ